MTEVKKESEQTKEGAIGGELISLEIKRAKEAGMNLLLPSTHIEGFSEFHSPVLDYVHLSPNPVDEDVYYHKESKKLVPTKQGLLKLARAAGIVWHPIETRRSDNRADRNYVSYRALGGVRTVDGAMAWIPGEYDMDLEVIEEKLRTQYETKGRGGKKTGDELQNYITYCVKRDLLYNREHKVKLCETKAMSRVIRSLLIGLKAGYTQKELSKPFVVARIVFKPNYSDPQVRKAMIDKAIDSVASIYGGDEPSISTLPPPTEIPHDIDDTIPENESGPLAEEPESDDFTTGNDGLTSEREVFLASDNQTKITMLETMIIRTDYDLEQLKKPLKQFTEEEFEGFYDKLDDLLSDIPF